MATPAALQQEDMAPVADPKEEEVGLPAFMPISLAP